MTKVTLSAVPTFGIPLTLAQAQALAILSKSHYDGECKAAAGKGGFIFGWLNEIEFDVAAPVQATRRQLDTVLKICELSGMHPDVDHDQIAAVCTMVRGAMFASRRIVEGWHATLDLALPGQGVAAVPGGIPAYAIGAFISKLPPEVLSALRNRGYTDSEIERMSLREAFDEFCTWHGLIHWGDTLYTIVGQLKTMETQISGAPQG